MTLLNKYLKQLFEGPCKGVSSSYCRLISLSDLLLYLALTCKPASLCHLQNEFVCSLFLDGPKTVQESVVTGNFN